VATAGGESEVHVAALSYFSRLADQETFCHLATVETQRRGAETAGPVCGVVDGAEWCQTFLEVHRPDAVRILDFAHASAYLAQIGQAVFGEGTAAAQDWIATQRHALKHAGPEAVLAAGRTQREVVAQRPGPVASDALEVVEKSLAYLEKRQAQLQYPTFQAHGYPIGSGIVESANKLVVEARLKGAGMHWARAHVNPMLALRTIACADRWAEAWPQIGQHLRQHHRARTLQRRRAPAPRRRRGRAGVGRRARRARGRDGGARRGGPGGAARRPGTLAAMPAS
jgi:hypothetical protein